MVSFQLAAADLRVRVFERGGKAPLDGVAVCLGTSASPNQFGASMTDSDGYVVFTDVPQAPLVVTASSPGFMSGQESLVISNTNRMLVLSLPVGGGGPQCAGSEGAMTVRSSGLEVRRFVMNDGAAVTAERGVSLNSRISGQPTEYRASEVADFSGADWQSYVAAPVFQLSAGPGRKSVYFQVRRNVTVNGGVLETRSQVVRDSITLRQAR
jgi:hypothetical protein